MQALTYEICYLPSHLTPFAFPDCLITAGAVRARVYEAVIHASVGHAEHRGPDTTDPTVFGAAFVALAAGMPPAPSKSTSLALDDATVNRFAAAIGVAQVRA
jgi:hypothetical protein